jgi:hypothetical protein
VNLTASSTRIVDWLTGPGRLIVTYSWTSCFMLHVGGRRKASQAEIYNNMSIIHFHMKSIVAHLITCRSSICVISHFGTCSWEIWAKSYLNIVKCVSDEKQNLDCEYSSVFFTSFLFSFSCCSPPIPLFQKFTSIWLDNPSLSCRMKLSFFSSSFRVKEI